MTTGNIQSNRAGLTAFYVTAPSANDPEKPYPRIPSVRQLVDISSWVYHNWDRIQFPDEDAEKMLMARQIGQYIVTGTWALPNEDRQ